MGNISKIRFLIFTLFLSAALWLSCGGESSDTGVMPPPDDGGGGGGKPKVTILRPSPCQRIYQGTVDRDGGMLVTIDATDDKKIDSVYVTIDDVPVLIFAGAPYSNVIPKGNLDIFSDGTHILNAIAYDNEGNSGSDEVEIRFDFDSPFLNNVLVVDSDADPLKLGGSPGAVFRINPESGTICTLASSNLFVDPSGIAIGSNGYIYVTDRSADLDGTGPGTGGVFLVLPDRFNGINKYGVSGYFVSPIGIDIAPDNTVYVADFGVSPAGAIFKIDPVTKVVDPVVEGNLSLLHPVGVTVDASGDLWIVDADADTSLPPQPQIHGSVWRCDPATKILSSVAQSLEFVTPFDVKPDGAGKLILVDGGDFDYGLIAKIFTVDPSAAPTAAATLLYSGSPLRSPSGIVRRAGGDYLIADRKADPIFNSYRGSILNYNPTSGEMTFFYSSDLFVWPMDVIESPE